jgi:membrane protein implicated in regulation of membrane protease activity
MMELDFPAWSWLILAALLAGLELISYTFVLIFFAGGALIAAGAAYLGAGPFAEMMVFSLSSLVLLLAFRKRFLTLRSQKQSHPMDIGAGLILSAPLAARSEGMISYQGSPWTAVNSSDKDLEQGTPVIIERTEGIKIFVKKKEEI